MKRRPYRLKFRPVRRPLDFPPLNFKLDLNMIDRDLKGCFKLPPPLLGQTVELFDVVKLAEALRPMAAAAQRMAEAFRVASILPPAYLERLRAAQDKATEEAIRDRQAWLDEATKISQDKYLDLRLRSALLKRPEPLILISSAY